MRDLAIGPEALGALTGAFFFGFAAMQIPCGFFFDRFGPRRTVVGMLMLAAHRRRALHPGAELAGAADRPGADGRGLRRHADRQHGGDLALVSAGPLLHPGRHGAVDRPARQSRRHHAAGLGRAGTSAGAPCSAPSSSSPRSPRSRSGWWCATRRPAIPSWPHAGAAARDAAGPDGGAAQPAPAADPGAEFLQLCLHLHRAGPVGRAVPARGAWPEPDRGRQRAARRRDRLPGRHARLRPARPPARHPQVDRHRRHAGDRLPARDAGAVVATRRSGCRSRAIVAIGFFSAPPAPW